MGGSVHKWRVVNHFCDNWKLHKNYPKKNIAVELQLLSIYAKSLPPHHRFLITRIDKKKLSRCSAIVRAFWCSFNLIPDFFAVARRGWAVGGNYAIYTLKSFLNDIKSVVELTAWSIIDKRKLNFHQIFLNEDFQRAVNFQTPNLFLWLIKW